MILWLQATLDVGWLNHRTLLHHVHGNLTGIGYRDDILQPLVLPALQAVGQGTILQEDNACVIECVPRPDLAQTKWAYIVYCQQH